MTKNSIFIPVLATKPTLSAFCVEKLSLSNSSTKIVNVNFVDN